MTKNDRTELLAGQVVGVHLIIPEISKDELAGFLAWDPDLGAIIHLVDRSENWPRTFDLDPFYVQGITSRGTKFSVFDTRVTQLAESDITSKLRGTTLVWDRHETPHRTWPVGLISTLNLTGWRNARSVVRDGRRTDNDQDISFTWKAPPSMPIRLSDGELRISTRASTLNGAESFHVDSYQAAVFEPDEPQSIDKYLETIGSTLLSFLAFAVDGPDRIAEEIYFDPSSRHRVEVWRWNTTEVAEPTEPILFFFNAQDLPDPADSLKKWWSLSERVRPALGLFADHLNRGRSYSPGRLITLFSAMEGYSREAHSSADFKRLREFAGVPPELIGATNESLSLLGAQRGYFAHLKQPKRKYTADELDRTTVDSIRRASALMQACLLREIGLTTDKIVKLLERRYSRWPVPQA